MKRGGSLLDELAAKSLLESYAIATTLPRV